MLQRSLARLAPSARVSMTPATNLHTLRLFSTKTANPASSGDSSKVYDGLRVSPAKDPYADILDPVNPPRLTYEHVKMLKNIDYSPVIERARKGDMFTVDQVLQILQEPSTLDYPNEPKLPTALLKEDALERARLDKTRCYFCRPDPTEKQLLSLHFTNVNLLHRFINERGMIQSRRLTNLCRTHQSEVRYSIKRARIMALLNPTSNWQVPLSYMYPDIHDAAEDFVEASAVKTDAMDAGILGPNYTFGEDKSVLNTVINLEETDAEQEKLLDAYFGEPTAPSDPQAEADAVFRHCFSDSEDLLPVDKFAAKLAAEREALLKRYEEAQEHDLTRASSSSSSSSTFTEEADEDDLASDFQTPSIEAILAREEAFEELAASPQGEEERAPEEYIFDPDAGLDAAAIEARERKIDDLIERIVKYLRAPTPEVKVKIPSFIQQVEEETELIKAVLEVTPEGSVPDQTFARRALVVADVEVHKYQPDEEIPYSALVSALEQVPRKYLEQQSIMRQAAARKELSALLQHKRDRETLALRKAAVPVFAEDPSSVPILPDMESRRRHLDGLYQGTVKSLDEFVAGGLLGASKTNIEKVLETTEKQVNLGFEPEQLKSLRTRDDGRRRKTGMRAYSDASGGVDVATGARVGVDGMEYSADVAEEEQQKYAEDDFEADYGNEGSVSRR